MKKTAIALSVAAIMLAGAANSAEIYNQDGSTLALGGRAEARLLAQDSKAKDNTRARIDVAGKTQLQDGFYGVGFYEGEYYANDNVNNKYIYAGLGSDKYGLVTFGENDGALGIVTDFTDIGNDFTGGASNKLATADRANNMFTYAGTFDT